MRKLVKITFINSADYDFFEMCLDGDVAVYGKNDAGKSTCARAVLFGEQGNKLDLNFSAGESFDYYLHKGDKDGMLVYDYEESVEGSPSVPYCLIITQRNINFVVARFSKNWVIDESGNLVIDWAGIRTRIEAQEGDVKVYTVSSLRHLGYVLQDSYDGTDQDMKYMCKRFSLFMGNGKRYSASARIITSLWKNGAMGQDDIKRIVIDRTEAGNPHRMEREPAFPVEAARNFAASFEDGWKDFTRYLSGELKAKMDQICGSLSGYDSVQTEITRYPSIVAAAYSIKKQQLTDTSSKIESCKGSLGEETSKYNSLKEQIGKDKAERTGKIAVAKNNIDQAKTAYNKIPKKDWVKIKTDINDLEHIGTINSEIKTLEKVIEKLHKDTKSIAGPLRDSIGQLEKEKDAFISIKKDELLTIKEEKENDKRIEELNTRLLNVPQEVSSLFNERAKALNIAKRELYDMQKTIEKNEEIIDLLSNDDTLFEQFSSDPNSFIPQGVQKSVVGKFLRVVVMFVCRHVFGITAFSTKELQELKGKYNENARLCRAEEENIKTDSEKKERELRSSYTSQLSGINLEYNKRYEAALKAIKDRNKDFEIKKKEIEKQITTALESSGFSSELIESKEKDLESKKERFEYLTNTQDSINKWKIILKDYDNIDVWETTKANLETEDNILSEKEKEKLSAADTLVTTAKAHLDEQEKLKKTVSGEINAYEDNIEELSRVSGWAVENIKNLIDESHPEELDPEELSPLYEYFHKWGVAMSERRSHLNTLQAYINDLKGMLSEQDFFNFTIKPIDSLVSDNDYIRVARCVKQRNDPASENHIDRYLNNWRQNWNQYLRFIVKIAEHSEEISNIEETVRHIESFIRKNNDARSIERIRFEVLPGSDNILVKTSRDIKEILDKNGIDVNVVDVSDGVDTSLFTLEQTPNHIRKQIVEHMTIFSHEVRQYRPSEIPPEDFFKIVIHMKEINKPETQTLNVDHLGSTGTTITLKAILAVGFVGEAIGTTKVHRSAVHLFVDEFGRIDSDNKRTISNLCEKFNIRLFSAEPEASKEKGNFDYGYSLYYDKVSHYRSGKIVKEKKREPKVVEKNQ